MTTINMAVIELTITGDLDVLLIQGYVNFMQTPYHFIEELERTFILCYMKGVLELYLYNQLQSELRTT